MEALSLYRRPKNIVTLATDQVIKLIVNNHYILHSDVPETRGGRTSPRELVMELHKIFSATKIYFKEITFSTCLQRLHFLLVCNGLWAWKIVYGSSINVGSHSGEFVFTVCLYFITLISS